MKKLLKATMFLFILFLTDLSISQEKKDNDQNNEKATNLTEEITEDIPFVIIEEVPVFPGCEKSLQKRRCFNLKLNKHVTRKFNDKIIDCLEEKEVYNEESKVYEKRCVSVLSSGKKRIYLQFKIGKTGEVEDIKVRAPHPKLKEEGIRILKLLPQMKPGFQEGEPVRVGYTLPITFNVE
ncbi:energy transducer TonB [Tenacibaculum sp. SDUM215027]|uniref:energy transducer TonB n=1 Tax=Tenacibaculum sp. SDUM215027 TaxID=3422596 RepID=UPI003D30F126